MKEMPLNMESFLLQNVNFVTILTVPLTGTGVLYPRIRAFL